MLYTATNLICTLGGNIALNGYVKKHYPYIRKYKNESITVLSAHREENIDTEKNFTSLFTAINEMAEKYDRAGG